MLIGLYGKAGSGKDTVGSVLRKEYGLEPYAFAAPLKAGLEAMLDLLPGALEDRKFKETRLPWLGKSPREMLQTLGTEWGRQLVDPDIWLTLMVRRWEMVKAMGLPGMVVTDVRFDNEAFKIRHMGGAVIEIVRPNITPVAAHASEAGICPRSVDETIVNDGSLADLRIRAMGTYVYIRANR
jgi:hypothetical protein